jgi:hypothetical protein
VEKVDAFNGKNRRPRDRFRSYPGRPTIASQAILMGSVASVFSGKPNDMIVLRGHRRKGAV